MTYHALLAVSGATSVGVWEAARPDRVAVLLGRTPAGWYAPAASGLPVALTTAGWSAFTVDTPAWGSQLDLDAVDAALALADTRGLDTSTVILVAHDRGAIAALNWSARHPERVAALALVSPIIDLEERWARLPTERASLEAAYGGTQATFTAAMPTWNPVAPRPWARRVRELVDRATLWSAAIDPATPVAVHQALAGYYGWATRTLDVASSAAAPHSDVVAQALAQAAAWDQRAAAAGWQTWATYRRSNVTPNDWTGGDAHISTELPDGRILFVHADTFTGPVNADESRPAPPIIRNSIVVENADGTLAATLHHTGDTGPSIRPPDHATGAWYWPGDIVVEDTGVRIVAIHVSPTGGFTLDGCHVVTLDAATLAQTATQAMPYRDGYHFGHGVVTDGDHTYILGAVPGEYLSGRCGIARAARGNILGPWEYWTGHGWTDDLADLDDRARLRTVDDVEIELDNPSLHRYPNGLWVLTGAASAFHSYFDVLTSWAGPARPNSWRHIDRVTYPLHDLGIATGDAYGGVLFTYGANQHPHMRSGPDKVLLSYAVNWSDGTPPTGVDGHRLDASFYQPRYVELTLPELAAVDPGTVEIDLVTAT